MKTLITDHVLRLPNNSIHTHNNLQVCTRSQRYTGVT